MSLLETQSKLCANWIRSTDEAILMGTSAFHVKRDGHKEFKVQAYAPDYGATEAHEMLHRDGLPVPKVLLDTWDEDVQRRIKMTEWVPGITFRELININEIRPSDYESLGEFVAKVNCYEKDGKHLCFENLDPKNLMRLADGPCIMIDLHKLIWSPFPENIIVRHVLTEDLTGSKEQTFELRRAFLRGYRKVRPLSLVSILLKQSTMNVPPGQEIFYHPDIASEEPQLRAPGKVKNRGLPHFFHARQEEGTIERYEKIGLTRDMTGQRLIDLGCGAGMYGFLAMLDGCSYVYGCDVFALRLERELFKASDFGKLLAYMHGYDGRDLHYKYININSQHFVKHLRDTRQWDVALCFGLVNELAPEHRESLLEYLKDESQVRKLYCGDTL